MSYMSRIAGDIQDIKLSIIDATRERNKNKLLRLMGRASMEYKKYEKIEAEAGDDSDDISRAYYKLMSACTLAYRSIKHNDLMLAESVIDAVGFIE